MMQAIRRCLAGLADFAGRDERQTFWYYILFIVIVRVVVAMLVSVPIVIGSFSSGMRSARQGLRDHELAARVMQENSGWLHASVWIALLVGFATIVLLVAACVRRLHDADRTGKWVLIPLVAYAVSLAASFTIGRRVVDAFAQGGDLASLQAARGNTPYRLFELIALVSVIVIGALASRTGRNRFGEEEPL